MRRDPRIIVAACAHAVVTAAALLMIAAADLGAAATVALGLLACAVLLPGLQVLLAARSERFSWLALLLVLVIGAGSVEVVASAGDWRASVLLGAAMLEFAVLFSATRRQTPREPRAREQR